MAGRGNTADKMWMVVLNLVKQRKRHDEEERAKEQVEESLLVFSCHQRCVLQLFPVI